MRTKAWTLTLVGLALAAIGCHRVPPASRQAMPANPRRQSPPPGLAARALAVGAPAPAFSLPAAEGERWSLNQHLEGGPVVLVFYRGHW